MKIHTVVLAFAVFTAALAQSHAAVIVVAPTSSTVGSFQITSDITFTIDTAGSANSFVMDEWVVSDGLQNQSTYSPSLAISINGGAPVTKSGGLADNLAGILLHNGVTANDGILFIDFSISVNPGNTLTLKAGVYSLGARSNFNPQATQTFTGMMFVADNQGTRLSPSMQVPEPSGLALAGIGSVVLLRRRSGAKTSAGETASRRSVPKALR